MENEASESKSEMDALEMSPKDSGSSLVRRRSSRKSIRAPQSQDRKLSEKEALVRRARAGVGVGTSKGYPESSRPIPQSVPQTKISTF